MYWTDADELVVAERPGLCPSCGHHATSARSGWLDRILNRTPPPARCAEIVEVDCVMSFTALCQCRHAFHGS
jgi:hypothetical protein